MVGHQSPKPKDDEPIQPVNENETQVSDKVKQPVENPVKLRPARKAPAPPDASGNPSSESKIPKIARPNRKAPPPPTTPTKAAEKEPIDHDHDPLYDVIGNKPVQTENVSDEQKDLVKDDTEKKSEMPVRPKREKPKVPVRYVKPKLITVPRDQIKLPPIRSEKEHPASQISRPQAPPPPPRPIPSNTITQNKFPSNKESMEHSLSENEESESFFNISPQRKFDTQLKRQDSSDIDEAQPYKSLSSFGSTFGKKDTVSPSTSHSEGVSRAHSDMKPTGIPKLSRQAVVEDDDSPTRNVIVHEQLKGKEDSEIESKDNKAYNVIHNKEKTNGIIDSPHIDDSIINEYDIIKTPDKVDTEDLNELPSACDSDDAHIPERHTQDQNVTKSVTPNMSKIPRHPGSDNVSRIPMSHNPRKKAETNDIEETLSQDSAKFISQGTDGKVKENGDTLHKDQNVENILPRLENVENTESFATTVNGDISDSDRPRTNSIDKPPVAPKPKPTALPKVLPKPKANVKPQKKGPADNLDELDHKDRENSSKSEKILENSPSPETVESHILPEDSKVSKIPHSSKLGQKSPATKGKLSKIPASPKVGRKNVDNKEPTSPSVSETGTRAVNLKQKPESPAGTRKQIPRHRTFSNESPSLRNRSNSPHGRTGIPSPDSGNRSTSPASKLAKPSGIRSPTGTPNLNAKPTGLPKKQNKQDSIDKSEKHSPVTSKPVTDITDAQSSDELESDTKPSRPSKPPRVQKQRSADSKLPKQGKSLLPVVHKSMDGSSPGGSSTGKPKTGIPMAKPPRPPQPKSLVQHHDNEVQHDNG